jgi:serine/threonine protein kinase/tetratricopeptide (TPR) repeat protein
MADRVGRQLGNYRLFRLLGKGSFAKVYLGEHLHLGTQAAIKVLQIGLGSDDVEDFRTEARTIARLVHPHIVRVFDFGLEETTPFLVMDYAPHGTLRKLHPKRSRLPLDTVLSYVTPIAVALQYAHEHKVIHRDIKPENMLLGAHHEVLLSDFGLAVVASSSQHHSLQEVVGTIAYVAPEQLEGNPCMASDQYALAVVVYEWLCGSLPFHGSHREIAHQHLMAAPPPLRKKVSTLPPAVEQVVLKALAKEPRQRFATIEAFATALQQAASPEGLVHGEPLQTTPTRSLEHIGRSQQSPLIGREQQLEVLRQFLRETEQQTGTPPEGHKYAPTLSLDTPSRAPCVMLLGEAGIGKTRLAEEVSREAQQRGWTVIWSRAHAQETTMPFQLWIEVLRNAMAQGHGLQYEVRQHPVFYQPLVTLLPELTDLLPQEVVSSTVPPEQVQLRIRETILTLLTTIGESAPLLIVLDDLHWTDLSSSELLGYLIRRLSDHRLLLMGTCRESKLPATHPLRFLLADLQRERTITTLHIPRLNDAQIGTLVGHLPGPLPSSIVQSIQNRAAGNPFFAEELARGVEAQPIAFDRADTLPDRISAVLDLRIGQISSACQRLLVRAAVLGGSFEFNSICAMEGPNADEDTVLDLLEEALQAGMLTEEGSGTRITYHFWHPLLVKHFYDGLSAARRTSLHRRAAEVLRQKHHGREEEGAAIIAYHLVNGGGEPAQIAHYAELAADRAYALSAYPEAERHYRLALEQRGTLPAHASTDERLHLASLLEPWAECMMILGNYEDERRLYEWLLQLHNSAQFPAKPPDAMKEEAQFQAMVWCEIGWTWWYEGDTAKARQCYERGEQMLRDAGVVAGPAWASLLYLQGSLSSQEGDYTAARSNAQKALTLFEEVLSRQHRRESLSSPSTRIQRTLAGDPVDLGRIHNLLALIAVLVGQTTDATFHLNKAMVIFEQYDRQREIAQVYGNLGDIHIRKAAYTLAQAAFHRSLSIAERIGETSTMSVCLGNLGLVAARLGDLPKAEDLLRRGLTLAKRIGDPVYINYFQCYLALVLQEQGKIVEASDCIRSALTMSRSKRIPLCIALALVTLGQLRIALVGTDAVDYPSLAGQPVPNHKDNRMRLLLRAEASLRHALSIEGLEAEAKIEGQLALAQVSLVRGELEKAQQQTMHALQETQRYELTWLLAGIQRLLGRILAAQDKYEQADEYFQQALQFFRESDMRLEYARALQSYGGALMRRGRAEETSSQQGMSFLQEAREMFLACNAVLDLQVVERMLSAQDV